VLHTTVGPAALPVMTGLPGSKPLAARATAMAARHRRMTICKGRTGSRRILPSMIPSLVNTRPTTRR
jgi:hypothetical protein